MTTKEEQYRQALEKIRATLLEALRLDAPRAETTIDLAAMVADRMWEWWNSPMRRTGSVMTQPKTFSQALAEQRPQRMMCLPCIAERKAAEQAGQPVESLPEVREAVTMLNGAPHCYEHITVQRNTGLVVPQ